MALLFDGAGDVAYVGGAPTLASFTMAGWFYIDATLSQYQPIILRFGDPGGSVSISLGVSAAGLMTLDSSSGSVVGPAVSTGTWHYVACVRSGTTHTLYMAQAGTDVSLIASGTYSIAADTGATVAIGGNGSTSYLDGGVAYMRLWSAALTLAELKLEKVSTTAVKTSTLWADYRTPNSGSSLNDSSGNSRTLGTLGSVGSGANPTALAPINLAGSAAARTSASASLSTAIRFAAGVTGSSRAAAALSTGVRLVSSGTSAASTTAALSTAIRMQSAAEAAASASADLTTSTSGALDFGSPNATRYHTAAVPNLPNADWTLGFWCRFARTDGSAYQYALSSGTLGGSNSAHVFIGEDSVSEARKVYVRAKGASGSEFNAGMSTSMAVDTTTPRLVVVQRRGSNIEIYCVDKGGTPSAPNYSGAHGLSGSIATSTLTIGQRADIAADRGWRNPLGEVFVLTSDSLTAAEVATLAAGAHIAAVRATRALDLRFRTDNASEPDESGNSRDSTRHGTGYALVDAFFPDAAGAALESTSSGSSSATAQLTTGIALAGGARTGASSAAVLTTGIPLSSASSASATNAAALAAGISLASGAAFGAVSSVALSTQVALASSSFAGLESSATLTDANLLLGPAVSVAGSSSASSLSTGIPLAASSSASARSSGSLSTSIALASTGQADSSSIAALQAGQSDMASAGAARSSNAATLSTAIRLQSAATRSAQAAADLLTVIRLSSSAQVSSDSAAELESLVDASLQSAAATRWVSAAHLTTQILMAASGRADGDAIAVLGDLVRPPSVYGALGPDWRPQPTPQRPAALAGASRPIETYAARPPALSQRRRY